jgi:hypothetical protein
MKKTLLTMICFAILAPLLPVDAESGNAGAYLGIPHDKSSSQVKEMPEETRKLVAERGEIQAVTLVTENQFWEDVKENRAMYVKVVDGKLFYAIRTAEHLAAPAGTPAPWRQMLGRCQVDRKDGAQPPAGGDGKPAPQP